MWLRGECSRHKPVQVVLYRQLSLGCRRRSVASSASTRWTWNRRVEPSAAGRASDGSAWPLAGRRTPAGGGPPAPAARLRTHLGQHGDDPRPLTAQAPPTPRPGRRDGAESPVNSRCARTARLTMIATPGSCHRQGATPHPRSRTNEEPDLSVGDLLKLPLRSPVSRQLAAPSESAAEERTSWYTRAPFPAKLARSGVSGSGTRW